MNTPDTRKPKLNPIRHIAWFRASALPLFCFLLLGIVIIAMSVADAKYLGIAAVIYAVALIGHEGRKLSQHSDFYILGFRYTLPASSLWKFIGGMSLALLLVAPALQTPFGNALGIIALLWALLGLRLFEHRKKEAVHDGSNI